MNRLAQVRPHVVGTARRGVVLVLAVIGLVLIASAGFAIGLDVGLSLGWIVGAFGIAIVAGSARAGLVPTIWSLWLVALWWFVFPPLVGYLTGDWTGSSRYTYPRMLGYAYDSAYAELGGGIERGIRTGFPFAILTGSIGYVAGAAISRVWKRSNTRR